MLIFISAAAVFAAVICIYFCISAKHGIEHDILDRSPSVRVDDCAHYYYNQLSCSEQKLYDALLNAIEKYEEKTGVIGCAADMDMLGRTVSALKADRPDIVALEGSVFSLENGWDKTRIDIEYPCTLDEIRLCIYETEKTINRLLSDFPDNLSTGEEIILLHDIITSNCECRAADSPKGKIRFDTAGALCGTGSSAGYASAFTLLCRMAGIDCITVYGAYNGEPHGWNIVWCDGVPCHVDTAADDAVLGFAPDMRFHGYICLSDGEMFADHVYDGDFILPACAESGHDYYIMNGLYAGDTDTLRAALKREIKELSDNGGDSFELFVGFPCDEDDLADMAASVISGDSSLPFKPVCRAINVRGKSGAYALQLFYKK